MFPFTKKRRGLTIVELLVVIAIIGLLIALLMPAIQAARQAGNRVSCISNLRQLAIAAHVYHDAGGQFPTGVRLPAKVNGKPVGGTNLWIELLPYIEQINLQQQWDYDDNTKNVAGGMNAVQAQVLEILVCPSDPLPRPVWELNSALTPPWSWGYYGMSSYGGNAGKRSVHTGGPPNFPDVSRDGVFFIDSSVGLADIRDGASNTLLFGERYHRDGEYDIRQPIVWPGASQMGAWGRWAYVANAGAMGNVTLHSAAPINYRVPPGGDFSTVEDRTCAFGSGHSGGANFALADGSARFIADTVPWATLKALSTRAGKEAVSPGNF
jgi:prepilin-type N-terminal cleavage/methylation domain-containing protein/prepilin-type processing-associated H-X9-DG protein